MTKNQIRRQLEKRDVKDFLKWARAMYMREWRKEQKRIRQMQRDDLSNLFMDIDMRKKMFLEHDKGEDLHDVKLFKWALDAYNGRLPKLK